MNDLSARLAALRELADRGETTPVAHRRETLKRFRTVLTAHRREILDALREDLGKPPFETLSGEMKPLLDILGYLIRRLPRLAAPRPRRVSLLNFPAKGYLLPEPYGLVLAAATWNYPLLLTLEPFLGAYAAGNKVVLKLSSRSNCTMTLVGALVSSVFPADEVLVVGREMHLAELAGYRFDYIFFTGSAAGGKILLRKAAENFTPVTLELGGKSPCIVDHTANLSRAARRIAWGKFSNAGQTCVAPDYLLVEESIRSEFTVLLRESIRELYGAEPLKSPDLGKIVDTAAYERLSALASRGRLLCGGEKDPESLRIAPTVIDRLVPDDPLLKEEIFGPVLPLESFVSSTDLLRKLPKRPKPLALYYFGKNRDLKKALSQQYSSGAVVLNDVVTHFLNFRFPFGGVGESGMGAYHGKLTFDTFSHLKPVMERSRFFDFSLRYPPYDKFRLALLKFFTR
ncbi:MAG: aldehyde dehydrogenase family protein [Victivallaceae bacterium]|nr:aldehyde dehydrogenase family protein [Victivallaceae bacterium]